MILELLLEFRGRALAPFVRVMCALIALGSGVFAFDPLVNPDSAAFDQQIFEVVERVAPFQVWGVVFAAGAALAIVAAVSGRFLVYLAAMGIVASAQIAWFLAIAWAKYVEGAALSSPGIGLWILALSLTFGTMIYPLPLAKSEEAAPQIETRSGTVHLLEVSSARRPTG